MYRVSEPHTGSDLDIGFNGNNDTTFILTDD
jgi:hypothetical protein